MSPMEQETVLEMIRDEVEPYQIPVFPISAVSGIGVKELLWYVQGILKELPQENIEFEPEFDPSAFADDVTLPFEVYYDEKECGRGTKNRAYAWIYESRVGKGFPVLPGIPEEKRYIRPTVGVRYTGWRYGSIIRIII